jgi:hypothetical protein
MDSKQLVDAIKAANAAIEDCFAALDSVNDYDAEHRAAICDDLDEASACLDSALRLAQLEAP